MFHSRALIGLALVSLVCACGSEVDETMAGGGGQAGAETTPPTRPEAGLVPTACPPSELQVDDACVAPGVEICSPGFTADGDGGCVPVLPAMPCAPGTMAIPGDTDCRPVAPCGAPPWGDIPVDSTTVYVDASFGGNSDGSAVAPWTTIQAAVDAASDGALVAVAAGTYPQSVAINGKTIRLWGVCPDQVEIDSPGASAGVRISQAPGSEVHTLAITGQAAGVGVWDTLDVVVDRVWLHDLTAEGVFSSNFGGDTRVTVIGSLVAFAVDQGIQGYDGELTVEQTLVVDTQPWSDGDRGRGIEIDIDEDTLERGQLTVRRSVIARNHDIGVLSFGSDLIVEDSVVMDNESRMIDGATGDGIGVRSDSSLPIYPTLVVRGSVVDNNSSCGICPFDAEATIESTVIKNTRALADGRNGMGVLFLPIDRDPTVSPLTLTLKQSLLANNKSVAVAVSGGVGTVESTIVRDTGASSMVGLGGRGIDFETNIGFDHRSSGVVRGVLVERNSAYGIVAFGSDLRVESAWVRDTSPAPNGVSGRGISAELEGFTLTRTSMEVVDSLVEGSSQLGILAAGAELSVENTTVRDTIADALGDAGWGIASHFELTDAGASDVTVLTSVVENNHGTGLFVVGATMDVDRTIVRGTRHQPGSDDFGDGATVLGFFTSLQGVDRQLDASLTITDSIIEDNARAGIFAHGAAATLGGSWLSCNPIQLDGELDYEFDDLGDNVCECDDVFTECKVLSSGLTAPDPLE